MINKPMKATNEYKDGSSAIDTGTQSGMEELDLLQYPVYGTPKLDGYRCIKKNGKALTNNLKPVGNDFIRKYIEQHVPDNVDGELMIHQKSFNEGGGEIRKKTGQPDFYFNLFDYVKDNLNKSYLKRMKDLEQLEVPERCVKLLPVKLNNKQEVLDFEKKCLEQGYEGVMLRSGSGIYKCNRATYREGYLYKMKQFVHFECEIIGFEEGQHNTNEQKVNELGNKVRSLHKQGMIPSGILGRFKVKVYTPTNRFEKGTELVIGSGKGLTDDLRKDIWDNQQKYLGKIIRVKYQDVGCKDGPRFPTFDGFREQWDISNE